MKKYLVSLNFDVADEGTVGLVKVITQEQLDKTKSIITGFGYLDGDSRKFVKDYAVEITDEEFKVLKKLKLTDLEFGECRLSIKEPNDDLDYTDDDYEEDEEVYDNDNEF